MKNRLDTKMQALLSQLSLRYVLRSAAEAGIPLFVAGTDEGGGAALSDEQKALVDKVIAPLINSTVNSAVANLGKQFNKNLTDLTGSLTQTLEGKLSSQIDELKNSLTPAPKPEGDKQPEVADVLAQLQVVQKQLKEYQTKTTSLEAEKDRLAAEKRNSDFTSAVTSLLNEVKVNSTTLAFNALKPYITYTDEGKLLLNRNGEEVSLTRDVLKDWLEKDAPFFLPAYGQPGSGARNTGDGRNGGGHLTVERFDDFERLTEEDQKKVLAQLVGTARSLGMGR